MEVWMSFVGEYGFPIAVTFYLLYRIEKKLDQLNQSVMYLGEIVKESPPARNHANSSPPLPKWDASMIKQDNG